MMYLVNKIMGVSRKILLSFAGLSLVACSSQSTYMSYQELQSKVLDHEERWESVQPQLERLDALEAELVALKQGEVKEEDSVLMVEEDTLSMMDKDDSMDMAPAPMMDDVTPIEDAVVTEEASSMDKMASIEETAPMKEATPMVAPLVIEDAVVIEETEVMAEPTPESAEATMAMTEDKEMSAEMSMANEAKVATTDKMMSNEKLEEPVVKEPIVQEVPTKAKPVYSGYGAQIAAYTNRDEAVRGWRVMQKVEPDSFVGLQPRINEKDVNGRHMYQLKVGPFYDRTFSASFCTMMSQKGHDCFVTQYNGETFSSN